jgi:hypothetical protein
LPSPIQSRAVPGGQETLSVVMTPR